MITFVPPSLTTEQYQFDTAGVLLNSSPSLPFVDIEDVEGLDSSPFRTQVKDREGTDGGYVDSEYESIRTVTISGTVYASPNATEVYLDQLKENFAPSKLDKAFYYGTDNGLRAVTGKSQGFKYSKTNMRSRGVISFQVQVICQDSRIYTPTLVQGTVSLVAGTTTGRGYNKGYVFGYGPASTSNSLVLNLSGNRPAPAVIRINGPCVDPVIINDTTGDTFTFTTTLAEGDFLEVDLANKSVTRSGAGNARNLLKITGRWFFLQPGANSLRFLGVQSPPTPVATMNVQAYSAWR